LSFSNASSRANAACTTLLHLQLSLSLCTPHCTNMWQLHLSDARFMRWNRLHTFNIWCSSIVGE
jgi:hypothetical protein